MQPQATAPSSTSQPSGAAETTPGWAARGDIAAPDPWWRTAVRAAELRTLRNVFAHAVGLMRGNSLRWYGLSLVLIVAMEGVTLIPFLGYTAKLALMAIFSAQTLFMLGEQEFLGQRPGAQLPRVFLRPRGQLLALVAPVAIGLVLGMVYLTLRTQSVDPLFYFLVSPIANAAPTGALFVVFKAIMYLSASIFLFVPGAVIIQSRSGKDALAHAVQLAFARPALVSAFLLQSIAGEWMFQISRIVGLGLADSHGAWFSLLPAVTLVVLTRWTFVTVYVMNMEAYSPGTSQLRRFGAAGW